MSAAPLDLPASWNEYALLSAAEMRRAEEAAEAKGVTTEALMQRAGHEAARIIAGRYTPQRTVVLCGPGNNGGDGYVCAEELRKAGWDVSVAALTPPDQMQGIAGAAAKEWQGPTMPLEDFTPGRCGLIVDALFGTGLSRPLEGAAKATLENLLATNKRIVALDLPSGVDADTGRTLGPVPKATLTITFCRKKYGHLLLPGGPLCGEIVIANIGIDDAIVDSVQPPVMENDPALWLDQFPMPRAEEHKYSRGNALIYGGPVMTGAARLAARAAQRIGTGLVTIGTPPASNAIYAEALESAIIQMVESVSTWGQLIEDERRNAILIGPGLGLGAMEAELVLAALESRKSCVLDADALSNFAGQPDTFIEKLHDQCVLTPHEGEFARLFGGKVDAEADKLTRARKAAELCGCTVLLKGADTIIATPDGHAIINVNAPPWLATAGAGDVLAGMILGLMAQKMPSHFAAAAAAWMHGQIAADFGPGLIAEDLVDGIPAALRGLLEPDEECGPISAWISHRPCA